jgi:hypothetical protein
MTRSRSAASSARGFKIARLVAGGDGVTVIGEDAALPPADLIAAATGFRPDLAMLRELRLDLDPAVESPTTLAPMIDPNIHSCGTVRPHGALELKHPEHDFFIAGMKSYGRAPTFLMLTGYEQVRSIAAALVGDWASAKDVQLVLPETGVCSSDRGEEEGASCCGAAPVVAATSCGTAGSGCGVPETAPRGFKALPVAAVEAGACCGPAPVAESAGCGCSAESPAETAELQLVGTDALRGNGGCCG